MSIRNGTVSRTIILTLILTLRLLIRHNLFIGTFFFERNLFLLLFRILFEEAFDVLILGVCKIPPPVHQVKDDVRMSSSLFFHQ